MAKNSCGRGVVFGAVLLLALASGVERRMLGIAHATENEQQGNNQNNAADTSPPETVGVVNLDTDGDGIPNADDGDIDGDGIGNSEDSDMDGDGVPNATDTDSDGNGSADNS